LIDCDPARILDDFDSEFASAPPRRAKGLLKNVLERGSFLGVDECRLETICALIRRDLSSVLIAGVSIRKAVIGDLLSSLGARRLGALAIRGRSEPE
jgi:hypothetical protein